MLCVLIYVRTGCGLRTVVSILGIFEDVLGESFCKAPVPPDRQGVAAPSQHEGDCPFHEPPGLGGMGRADAWMLRHSGGQHEGGVLVSALLQGTHWRARYQCRGDTPCRADMQERGLQQEDQCRLPEPHHQARCRQREQQEGEPRTGDDRLLQKAGGTAGKGRRHLPHIIRHHRV